MSDTKVIARSALDVLSSDHRRVKDLFRRYEKLTTSPSAQRSDLFDEIREILTLHARLEEEIFYPAVAEIEDEATQTLLRTAREEHAVVKRLLDELSEMSAADSRFDPKMKVLAENVEQHAEEEEAEIFPQARKLGRERLQELSFQMDALSRQEED